MLLISDSNVFIDFDCCGLISQLFALPEDIAVPDILFYEELEEQHSELTGLGLMLLEVSDVGVEYAQGLKLEFNQPSANDLLALSLAREKDCPLVTGDGNLRVVAKREKVELKGSIWIMQRLIEERIVTTDEAAVAFKTMRDEKRRLPWLATKRMLDEMKLK